MTSTSIDTPPPWHATSCDEALATLASDAHAGLSEEDAASRLAARPETDAPAETGRFMRLVTLAVDQLRDIMSLVLIVAAVISMFIGETGDAVAILLVLTLATVLGVMQQARADQALRMLRALGAPRATVRRGGVARSIATDELVAGDIVELVAGDRVPADVRIVAQAGLLVDESALTGESVPVAKHTEPVAEDVAVHGRESMAFQGTLIRAGHGDGLIVAVGQETELGRLTKLVAEGAPPQTPLQRRLSVLGAQLTWAVLAICVLLVVGGVLAGEPLVAMVMMGLSLAVAAIPEGLPAVVTVALALGARRMAARNALVRRLSSVEGLGEVSVICSDKTGTMTENRMRLQRLETVPGREMDADLVMALCNDAHDDTGDPTELALSEHLAERYLALRAAHPRLHEDPFDARRARMTTLNADIGGQLIVAMKGAVEVVTERCVAPPEDLVAAAHTLAEQGLRVLALAIRRVDAPPDGEAAAMDLEPLEQGLTLVGLVGLADPVRAGVAEAVAECKSAGIEPIMITGDHADTAAAIGREVAIDRVHARVAPEGKLAIIKELQQAGHVVAMTGDGVNDAPALQSADVGVAMGKAGTDVARETADLVLMDDHFATIVAAVREGRRIFANIRKFIGYSLASNLGEILVILFAPLIGLPIPLLPVQVLWINIAGDGLPGLALALEPPEKGVMQRPPRSVDAPIVDRAMWIQTAVLGVIMAVSALAAGIWADTTGSSGAFQTVVLTSIVFSQLFHVQAIRNDLQFSRLAFRDNPWMIASLVATAGAQLVVIYWEPANVLFHTTPLTAAQLAVCVLPGVVLAVVMETWKFAARRRMHRAV